MANEKIEKLLPCFHVFLTLLSLSRSEQNSIQHTVHSHAAGKSVGLLPELAACLPFVTAHSRPRATHSNFAAAKVSGVENPVRANQSRSTFDRANGPVCFFRPLATISAAAAAALTCQARRRHAGRRRGISAGIDVDDDVTERITSIDVDSGTCSW